MAKIYNLVFSPLFCFVELVIKMKACFNDCPGHEREKGTVNKKSVSTSLG